GSGTKVAEALINLLAIGCPTHQENGVYTSAGDSLQIWRVDPDSSSGAAKSLQDAVNRYRLLQEYLGNMSDSNASSRWSMDLDIKIHHLDPLQLPGEEGNSVKTLRGILDSASVGKKSAKPLLNIFYDEKDFEVKIDRGFYQKPFIGAPAIALFTRTLTDAGHPNGQECRFSTLEKGDDVRFFICGSLHGGTGACGVPIIAKFLGDLKKEKHRRWRVGGCLLSPYFDPPPPPFEKLAEGQEINDQIVEDRIKNYSDHPAFSSLKNVEEKRELAKQILLGFYANPNETELRARHSLEYYKSYIVDSFSDLYLVGKSEPDTLKTWSNGGLSQENPLNSAEIVAALTAIDFFSKTEKVVSTEDSYIVATAPDSLNSKKMLLSDLPIYTLRSGQIIDPERVFLATSVLYHLILYSVPWHQEAKRMVGFKLASSYGSEAQKMQEKQRFEAALKIVADFIRHTLSPKWTIGWEERDINQIEYLLSDSPEKRRDIAERLKEPTIMDRITGNLKKNRQLVIGNSYVLVKSLDFGQWCPVGSFTIGDYLRYVWSKLYDSK
ncbi:MAG: hypothetical protein JNN15_19765, partial [Blastocatellia bacterium]|nr:hypothetical protein [Blastocatellia bacterium]